MKKNDIFFDNLSSEFDRRIEIIVNALDFTEYASQLSIDQCMEDAKKIVKKYKKGFQTGSLGNFMNGEGKYINYDGNIISAVDINRAPKGSHESIVEFFFKNDIKQIIDTNESVLIRNGDPETSISEYIKKAFICHQWGVYKHYLNERDESYKYLIKALRFLSMWDGATAALYLKDSIEEMKKERLSTSSKGGKSKKDNYILFKLEIIKLLLKNKPKKGWESKNSAITSLLPELKKFMKDEQQKLDLEGKKKNPSYSATEETLYKRIYDYSIKDDIIRAIFAEVVKEK